MGIAFKGMQADARDELRYSGSEGAEEAARLDAADAREAASILDSPLNPIRSVTFVDEVGDGEGPWTILVGGRVVIEHLRDTDVSSNDLQPLWDALCVHMTFK